MLAQLRNLVKSISNQNTNIPSRLCGWLNIQLYSKSATPADFQIVDVNIDTMMNEDDEFASNYNYEVEPEPEPGQMISGAEANIAPVDVDPWSDEELQKGGTVDMEYVDKLREEIHYPEPPKERTGFYEFEGIKIWLPKKMLTPATYRYRLEEGEEESLADDIRICKFEKCKPSSSSS